MGFGQDHPAPGGKSHGRSRMMLRAVFALLLIGGLGAGAWFTWTIVGSLDEGIRSIDLDDENVGYAPASTAPPTTTTTTLPPRDLEVLVVTPAGEPAGPGVEIRVRELGERN